MRACRSRLKTMVSNKRAVLLEQLDLVNPEESRVVEHATLRQE